MQRTNTDPRGGNMQKSSTREQSDLDEKVCALARSYLLERSGITPDILDKHLSPPPGNRKPDAISTIYLLLLKSAQSAQSMPNVIGGSIGGVENLGRVLFDFNPAAVAERYPRSEEGCEHLFDDIKEQLAPRGKLNYNPRSLWRRFCGTITSGAAFLARFPDAGAFYRWAEPYTADEDERVQLANMVADQVDGVGFALASDFLKEVGFAGFSKPDVHIKEIFSRLGLSRSKDDIEVFKAIARIARNTGTNAYEIDQLFWLVGSGDLYLAHHRIPNSRAEFIAIASKSLEIE